MAGRDPSAGNVQTAAHCSAEQQRVRSRPPCILPEERIHEQGAERVQAVLDHFLRFGADARYFDQEDARSLRIGLQL